MGARGRGLGGPEYTFLPCLASAQVQKYKSIKVEAKIYMKYKYLNVNVYINIFADHCEVEDPNGPID